MPGDSNFLMWIVDYAWAAFAGVFVWIHKRIASNEKELGRHKLYAAETFVRKDDMKEMKAEINGKLDQIITKLDRKADK